MPDLNTPTPTNPQFVTQETLRVATIMQRFDRRRLAAFVEVAIDLFDGEDGDPDIEDATNIEDEGITSEAFEGPGCPASDEDDRAYPEWHGRGRHKEAYRDSWKAIASEDAEEDDGGGDDLTEDTPGLDATSRALANAYGDGAGCPFNGDVEPNGDEGDYSGGE